jgi:transcriptional regulator with XRE-family HTH domain
MAQEERDTSKKMRGLIAERVKELLKERGLTQRAFAKMIGMQESYVSKILSGDANLSIATISAIEDALDEPIFAIRFTRLSKDNRNEEEIAKAISFFSVLA